jgi:hypothetical protein
VGDHESSETRALGFAQHYFENGPYTNTPHASVAGSWMRDSLDS